MTLPNRLTLFRMVLAPVFFIVFFLPLWIGDGAPPWFSPLSGWLLALIFISSEVSDLLDGIIARRRNLVTDLGKVLDPFSDVLSRVTYFICFAYIGIMPVWTLLVIIYRELGVTFLRMVLMGCGTVMAAGIWGKAKAVLYAVSGGCGLLFVLLTRLEVSFAKEALFAAVLQALFILAASASLLSLALYVRGAIQEGGLSSLSR